MRTMLMAALLAACGGSPYEGEWAGTWGSDYDTSGARGTIHAEGRVVSATVDADGNLEGSAENFEFTGSIDDDGNCTLKCSDACWGWSLKDDADGQFRIFSGRMKGEFTAKDGIVRISVSMDRK